MWSLLATACAVQIAAYSCFFNLTPFLPRVGLDLELDAGALGALVGVGGIVALLAQLPAGTGGDVHGRRPFFALGMLLALVGLALRSQAEHPLVLLLSQMALGAALGIVSTNAFALMAGGARQGSAFGIVNASISVGQVVGYLVAGTFGSWVGWRSMSLEMALVPLVVLVVVLRVRALAFRPTRGVHQAGAIDIVHALSHPRRLMLAGLAALTLGAGQGACYLLPFAVQAQELGPLAAAIVLVPYVLGSVVAAPFSGVLSERFGSSRVIVMALLLGGLACLAAVTWGSSIWALGACNVLIGVSVNTTLPVISVLAVTMKVGRPIGAGTAIAGLRIGQSLGPFIGPTVAGAMLARSGVDAAWVALAACLLLSAVLHGLTKLLSS
ncbi:MAG TPA: MFS transporter [Chloroflexota bacterium]|nr:MFS transporter [Chloroflexota bacterium]